MTKATILLIGNCVVDQIWELEHFPEQDEEMRAMTKTRVLGGNACNSAQILAKLGNDVEIVSSLAQDSTATWLLQQLSAQGIKTRSCIQKSGYSTAESSIWINTQNGSRTIVHHRDLPELSVAELLQVSLQEYQWIHFEGRNIDTLITYLSEIGKPQCPVSLEIEKDRAGFELLLPFVNTVIVSSAFLNSKNITADQCLEDLSRYNAKLNIVCTLGAAGLVAKDRFGKYINLNAEKVDKVVDTVGARDCFIAGLINSLNQQKDFEISLIAANQLAAQKIQFKGMNLND